MVPDIEIFFLSLSQGSTSVSEGSFNGEFPKVKEIQCNLPENHNQSMSRDNYII